MKQFFALVLACTLAAGGATAMTYHSTSTLTNCADYSGATW